MVERPDAVQDESVNPFGSNDDVDWADDKASSQPVVEHGDMAQGEATDIDDGPGSALITTEMSSDESGQAGEAEIIDDGVDEDPADRASADTADTANSIEAASRARRAARRFMPQRRSAPGKPLAQRLQAIAVGMMLAIIAAGIHYRTEVVRQAPSLASLYALVGFQINLRGLAFEDVVPQQLVEGGIPVLRVEGAVRNISNTSVAVPPVELSLTSQGGQAIYRWVAKARTNVLEPGETTTFSSLLSAPPRAAQGVAVRFEQDDGMQLGLR